MDVLQFQDVIAGYERVIAELTGDLRSVQAAHDELRASITILIEENRELAKELKGINAKRGKECSIEFELVDNLRQQLNLVLTGVGVELAFHKHRTGYYLLGCSMFVLIAEITWVATVFLQLCVRHDHRLWKYWTGVTWFSDWKKSLVYVPMSVIPVLRPHGLWLAYLAGGQLLALALCHFLLTFRTKKKTRRRNKGRLLQDADSFESSKFEEITECLDDGLPEPMPGSSHSLSGGLVEREAVLEI